MNGLSRFMKSSVGAKYVMAITGILLVVWLFLHMAGNLQMFLGPKAMNDYARFLKHDIIFGKALWLMRIGLLVLVVLHIWSAVRLVIINREARPVSYVASPQRATSNFASRTMIWSGVIVLAFLIYHLLHFTVGVVQPQHFALQTADGYHNAYQMTLLGFQQPAVSAFYILAQGLLAFHLYHGISSFFQSMGWNNGKYRAVVNSTGPALSIILFLGFISVPLGVLLGIIK